MVPMVLFLVSPLHYFHLLCVFFSIYIYQKLSLHFEIAGYLLQCAIFSKHCFHLVPIYFTVSYI